MNKIKVLAHCDAPTIDTGFGVVSRYILKALHETGNYEIDVLGINYFGSFYDKEEFPYHIVPARLIDPNDPYGNRMLLRSLSEKKYDILFIINDTHVTNDIAPKIAEYKAKYNQDLKIVYYYPVDCVLNPRYAQMVTVADRPVTYTQFAWDETVKQIPSLKNKLQFIYHGTDNYLYRPLSAQQQLEARWKYLRLKPDDKTFVWINVNRNSIRKNIPGTILAFSEFKKRNPDKKTLLYLHTVVDDNGIDLSTCLWQLGLSHKTDVIFPVNYSSNNSAPAEVLNEMYNMSDCYITTTRGEGFGLTVVESMAAGTPVIAPHITAIPEILGQNSERGFTYQCKEKIFCENTGYREEGRTEDIVRKMEETYGIMNTNQQAIKVSAAKKFVLDNSWENITEKWIDLFANINTPGSDIIAEPL